MVTRPADNLTNWPIFSLKAGLAAGLALLLCQVFKVNDPISGTFVAIMCITPTLFTGLRAALEQAMGSLIGGALATLLVLSGVPQLPALVVAVGLAVFAAGMIRMPTAYSIASFTALYVVLMPEHVGTYVHRMGAVLIAAGSALLVNFLLSGLQYRQLFARRIVLVRAAVAYSLARGLEEEFGYAFAMVDDFSELLRDVARDWLGQRTLGERISSYQEEASRLRYVLHFGLDALIRKQPTAGLQLLEASKVVRGDLEPSTVGSPVASAAREWAEHVLAVEGRVPRMVDHPAEPWSLKG